MIVAGDPALNAWYMWGCGFMGLAYDAKEDRLVTGYAAASGDAFGLAAADPAPEPATLGLVALGLVALAARRRKR